LVCQGDKTGETIEMHDDGRVVASLMTTHSTRLEERVQQLVAQGLLTLGSEEPWPEEFFTRPLPKADGSVLQQLLADRDED
jgi:hypothetical protein